MKINYIGVLEIFKFEISRFKRTYLQSLVTPIITTLLFIIVFGNAIGRNIATQDGMNYSNFIVPGLIMLSVFNESLNNSSFGIYLPKFTGTIYEIFSAPLSTIEILTGYIGASTFKSVVIGSLILTTSLFIVDLQIKFPLLMIITLILISMVFCLLGFITGILADSFDRLQFLPSLVITPLAFLGGVFYSINQLPDPWLSISYFNPLVYFVSAFRWTFTGYSDVKIIYCYIFILLTLIFFILILLYIFKSGKKIKS